MNDYKPNGIQKDILSINQHLLYQPLCLSPCQELFVPTKGKEKQLTLPEGQEDDRLHHEELEDWAIGTEQLTCGKVEKEEGVQCQADRDVVDDRHIEVATGYTEKRRYIHECLKLQHVFPLPLSVESSKSPFPSCFPVPLPAPNQGRGNMKLKEGYLCLLYSCTSAHIVHLFSWLSTHKDNKQSQAEKGQPYLAW